MLKCVILDDYQQVAEKYADWSTLREYIEINSLNHNVSTENDLEEILKDADIVVAMRERTALSQSIINRLSKLKLIVTTGMRNSVIDIAAAKMRGIIVCGTASSSDPPTELTWALMLCLMRSINAESENLRNNGPWQSTIGSDLYGKNLGVIGLGKIGSRVARIGLAFGMNVFAWSQNLLQETAEKIGVTYVSDKRELLAMSDVVTLHLVLSDRTAQTIGKDDLRQMRQTAYLVNTSRAGLVDTNALLEALREKWIAGAAVDVFDIEPLPRDSEIRQASRLLATPHLGYVTDSNYRRYFAEVVEDIRSSFKTG